MGGLTAKLTLLGFLEVEKKPATGARFDFNSFKAVRSRLRKSLIPAMSVSIKSSLLANLARVSPSTQ